MATVEASMVESMEKNMDPVARAMEKASATGARLHRLQGPRSTSPKASQTPLHRHHLPGTSTQSPPTIFVMHTSSEEEDFKWARSTTRKAAAEPLDGHAQPLGERRHGTALNFAVFHAGNRMDVLESYFDVRGEQRHGLLIDPGAASGLIGSDTLKQLMDNCITPFGKQHEVSMNYNKTTPVSGTSGEANQTLGEISIPLRAGGYSIMYTADVSGGSGSTCPALFGNPTLCRLDASIFANCFANGDGLIMVGGREKDSEEKHYRIFRLPLTDSGHYILPTDHEQTARVAKKTKKRKSCCSRRRSLRRVPDIGMTSMIESVIASSTTTTSQSPFCSQEVTGWSKRRHHSWQQIRSQSSR